MVSSTADDRSSGDDAAERAAAAAVCDLLAAREADPATSARDFVPSDPKAAAAYWRAVEGLAGLCNLSEPAASPEARGFSTTAFSRTPSSDTGDTSAIGGAALSSDAISGYRILSQISKGGQGVVYRAIQISTKREVAIKVLGLGNLASVGARRRFEREIELVAQLRHPNIIAIFHSGETADGQQFYVMDFVKGEPLHQYVRDRQLSLRQTVRLFRTICDAVQYAHQRGVIHRDLKPTNILVDNEGRPRILDFGLAKHVSGRFESEISVSRDVIGTLPYMSPEQARGDLDGVDTRTDVYSLGVVLFRILTGQHPYPISGPMSDVLRHIAETVPASPSKNWTRGLGVAPRSTTWPGMSSCPINTEIETIVLKSLTKERERRYQSVGELSRDLTHFLEGEPIEARRDSALYVLHKSLRRYTGAVMITLLFVLMILGFGVVMWWQAVEMKALAREKEVLARRDSDVKAWALEQADIAQTQSEQLRQIVYRYSLRLAQIALRNGDYPQAIDELEQGDPELRRWEWRYLQWCVEHPEIQPLTPRARSHVGQVHAIEITADNRRLITIGEDGGLIVRDVLGVFSPLVVPGLIANVQVADMDDHGKRLVVANDSGMVQIWDVATMTPVRNMAVDVTGIEAIALSPAGGGQIAIGDKAGQISLWNESDGKRLMSVEAHAGSVDALAFLPSGDKVVSGSEDGFVKVWYAAAFSEPLVLGKHDGAVLAIAIDKSGLVASAGSDGVVKVWGVTGERERASLILHEGPVRVVTFGADENRLITGSDDGTVRVWDVVTGTQLLKIDVGQPITALNFGVNGTLLAIGTAVGDIRILNATKVSVSTSINPFNVYDTGDGVENGRR